jgi:hypothetical protein
MSPGDLELELAKSVDAHLASQLIQEFIALEEAFLLRKWKYTQLDGGRFAEVAARIVYSLDSQNLNLTKSVDDCLRYIDNPNVAHTFPEAQSAIHLAKVIRAVYKLRSQRGAVHVSPTYTANEIDSRFVVESARWVFAELIRILVTSNREDVAEIVRKVARFPLPLIRTYSDVPLLQSVSFTTEEEVLAHLMNAERGLLIGELITSIPKSASGVRLAVKNLESAKFRQIVSRSSRYSITDLGIRRIELRIAQETDLKD